MIYTLFLIIREVVSQFSILGLSYLFVLFLIETKTKCMRAHVYIMYVTSIICDVIIEMHTIIDVRPVSARVSNIITL